MAYPQPFHDQELMVSYASAGLDILHTWYLIKKDQKEMPCSLINSSFASTQGCLLKILHSRYLEWFTNKYNNSNNLQLLWCFPALLSGVGASLSDPADRFSLHSPAVAFTFRPKRYKLTETEVVCKLPPTTNYKPSLSVICEFMCSIMFKVNSNHWHIFLILCHIPTEKDLVMGMIKQALEGVDLSGHQQQNLQQLQAFHPGASPNQLWRKPQRTRSEWTRFNFCLLFRNNLF